MIEVIVSRSNSKNGRQFRKRGDGVLRCAAFGYLCRGVDAACSGRSTMMLIAARIGHHEVLGRIVADVDEPVAPAPSARSTIS